MQQSPSDVAGLIRRAKAYDESAFTALYHMAVKPVYRYLSVRVTSGEEAEELTQDVFVAAVSGIKGLRAEDEAGLYAWLYQIARYKLADHLRRRYRQPEAPLGDLDLPSRGDLPEEEAEAAEDRAEVQQALEQLTPEQREVIVYKYVLGYDNQRTADLVGKNANAVNQLHHRALGALSRLLTRDQKSTA